MQRPGLEVLSKALTVCLQLTFAAGVVITVFLSVILKRYFNEYFFLNERYYDACVVLLTPCGLSSLNILWRLISMMKSVNQKNPFVVKNVSGLKHIAVSSFVISAMFFILMFVQPTALTFAIGYIFLIAGFSAVVLAGLFQKAVEYKADSDLTI